MALPRVYKTTDKQREYQRKHYLANIEKYREYKQAQMRARRANPEINEKIKVQTRKWYKSSGRDKRQKEYLRQMRENQFMKWRVKLFNQHYGTKYTEKDFQILWDKQNGECYFTGQKLDNTANIDHIIPVKRGGTHELSNLRWTTKQVNFMKRDMLDEEFLNVVKAIMERLMVDFPKS